ncbi:ArsC family reductase [Thiopseudomonas alkaliphila]|uniref:ArsC family reductase n=1 Tax=Thiopseudomonas alkaliphila TaxID=1697053 RepID=UPI002578300F|nr:ArsC family reductase [Thiopseudomonas alkaliphila]MDM1707916.1 ArsC family reductase [Thiopseudomonas alkaliphila]
MSKPVMYGIKNCDTIRKARKWLTEHGIEFEFHDYKPLGADAKLLAQWCNEHGWEKILNKAGTTFRKLDEAQKNDLNQDKAIALMLENPSMIKRPVLALKDTTLVGFKPEYYAEAFA